MESPASAPVSLLPTPGFARSGVRLLSPAERHRMLLDIARVALAIGRDLYPDQNLQDADANERFDVGRAVTPADACPRERLAFLQAAVPRIEAALHRLEAAPPSELRPDARWIPLARARRARPKDVMIALATLPASGERQVREARAVPSVDIAVNRCVKSVLAVWSRDLAALSDLALAVGAPDVARESERLRRRLRMHLTRFPWQILPLVTTSLASVTPSHWQNPALCLVRDTWVTYRRGFGFDYSTPLFHLPARDCWLLYEQWCLFQTANALRALGFRASDAPDFAISRGGLGFSLIKGRASRLDFADEQGREVRLYYSRPFETGQADRDGLLSRSHQMRPDIVIEAGGHLLILDAKLKPYAEPEQAVETNTPLTDDLNQCHAYRDGIRWKGGRRAVRGAWLLYAGRPGGGNRAVIAYPDAHPNAHADLPFGAGEIGAVLLRPSPVETIGLSTLAALIQEFLHRTYWL